MENKKKKDIPEDISDLLLDIQLWRSNRDKMGPMPEILWQQAEKLARIHGVTKVAQHLRLHHNRLKQRVEEEEGMQCGGALVTEATTFIEIEPMPIPEASKDGQAVVEIRGADGAVMTIHLPGQTLDVPGLVQTFFQR